jgi:hypothetical protein
MGPDGGIVGDPRYALEKRGLELLEVKYGAAFLLPFPSPLFNPTAWQECSRKLITLTSLKP